jgi:hypothetical protein
MTRPAGTNDRLIRTIGQLAAAAPGWVRLYCETPGCGHHAALPLAPLVLRWGPSAPRGWLETRFRCSKCGRRNTSVRLPSNIGSHGPEIFQEKSLQTPCNVRRSDIS